MENLGVNIAITQFKSHIANAILNNQEKLNKNKDAYISADELPDVLNNFGTNDVTKLLKRDNEKYKGSIFSQGQNDKKMVNIMALKDENASAILNNQDKLNPDNDSYLNEEEVKEVLKYFGAKDISSLLKDNNELADTKEDEQKVEDKNDAPAVSEAPDNDKQDDNQTIKAEQPDENSEVKTEQTDDNATIKADQPDENPTENPEGNGNATDVVTAENVLETYGTAANELDNQIRANLSFATAGTPYASTMEALQKLKNKRGNDEDTFDLDFKMEQLNDLAQTNLQAETDNNNNKSTTVIKKTISYGKDGENKAELVQSFSLDTNSAIKGKQDQEEDENNSSKAEEGEAESESSDNKTKTDVDVSYKVDFRTLNPLDKGNIRARGSVNVGSDNCDIHAVGVYSRQLKNGGIVNFTANLNETIEGNNNKGNYGASFDYTKNKFSTGVMGYYNHNQVDGEKDYTTVVEASGRYGNVARGVIGMEYTDGMKYYYAKAAASGKKTLPNSGLSLYGNVEGEYGVLNVDGMNNACQSLVLKANGALSFTSKDLNASLYGNVAYRRLKYSYIADDNTINAVTASVTGTVDTKNIGISTTFTALNGPGRQDVELENPDSKIKNTTTLSTSVQLAIKNVFGEKVTPVINYNVCNEQGVKHNIGAGIIIRP